MRLVDAVPWLIVWQSITYWILNSVIFSSILKPFGILTYKILLYLNMIWSWYWQFHDWCQKSKNIQWHSYTSGFQIHKILQFCFSFGSEQTEMANWIVFGYGAKGLLFVLKSSHLMQNATCPNMVSWPCTYLANDLIPWSHCFVSWSISPCFNFICLYLHSMI